jgi:uncharacterized protein
MKILSLFLITLVLISAGFAKDVIPLTYPVIDESGILSGNLKNELNNDLKNYFEKTDVQIQVVILKSLDGDPIENYSIKLFDSWKLGSKKTDKGVLFLVSMAEKKTRLEVGRGLEGDLTDLKSNRILRDLRSYLKDKDYDGGIKFVVNSIKSTVKKKDIEPPKTGMNVQKLNKIDVVKTTLLLVVIIVAFMLLLLFFGIDGFFVFRIIFEIIISLMGGGSGGGGGSAGGGSSSDWD